MYSSTNNLAGKLLDRYVLEQRIKRSRMSAVYRARQVHLSRPVAIKVMNSDLEEDFEFLLRFRREARIMAQLEHANIIPIYDYGEQEGLVYLVMPYFTRGSLHDLLANQGRCSLHQILSYLQQAAAALDYTHARGVVHLDLKPSNFLLHNDGRLVLTDFGIAHILSHSESDSASLPANKESLLGTPEYMAPEIIRGEQIDYRADIYELGIILYQLLSGELPFKGVSTPALLFKQLYEYPPPLHYRDETIPLAVDTVVRRAIAKRREERYPSAMALALALQAASNQSTPAVIHRSFSTAAPAIIDFSLEGHPELDPHTPAKMAVFEPEDANSAQPESNMNTFRIFVITLLVIALVVCGFVANLVFLMRYVK